MMTHLDFIASLSPDQKTALHTRSNSKGIAHMAGHLGALILMGTYIAIGSPFWWLLLLPYGVALIFLFTLAHECTHATPFASTRLCDFVGHATALPLIQPFLWFRYFHLAHHKHTNDPARDPELENGPRPETWSAYIRYVSGWGIWTSNIQLVIRHARGQVTAPYLPRRRHAAMIREARLLLICYGLIMLSLCSTPIAFWLLILPALIGQPFLRLYLLAEHGHCPSVANMLENTRTTLTNRILRFFAWNMPYHAEHHSMPLVPFHALPELHDQVQAHLKSVSNSYTEFTAEYARKLPR